MTDNPFKPAGGQVLFPDPVPQSHGGITTEQVALAKQSIADNSRAKQLEKFAGITSFDWKQIPPPFMAELLMQTPFRGGSGEPDYYLSAFQAYRFAIRCFEIGLSPLSTEVWYNPKNNMTNVTFEGKLKLARINNLHLSPPVLERIPEDVAKPLVAYKCTIQSPAGPSVYTATLKEWKVGVSPVWRDRPDHMLQLRAAEKCLSFASGIGSSELMGEQDLAVGTEAAAIMPEVSATEFTEVKLKGEK